MKRYNFSSVADRRWQRRYERIQQRKEEERERREIRVAEEYSVIHSVLTVEEIYREFTRAAEQFCRRKLIPKQIPI